MTLFTDLGIVIVIVSIVAIIFSRFKMPLTVGYILAGIIVGPHFGPKLITNPENIEMLSDLGVMFLMFSIGLGFSFKQLRAQGLFVTFPAIWDVLLMVVGGYLMGSLLGWSQIECFLLGLIVCNSSTSIAAKTLEELGLLKERFATTAFAIAVIEDILSILLVAILYGIGQADCGGDWWPTALAIGKQMGILLLFLIGVIVFCLPVVPRLLNSVAMRFGNEIVLMTSLGFCFGVSLLAIHLGLSLVLGAFLAGTILSYVNARERLIRTVKPISQLFAAVFFVSVGLLVDPTLIYDNLLVIIFITFGMILLKCINGFIATTLVGERPTDALRTGLALGQIAEFAFIISLIGNELEMTTQPLFQISVGVALLCTAINPYLLRYAPFICGRLRRIMPQRLRHSLMAYRTTVENMRNRRHAITRAARIRMYLFLLLVNASVVLIFSIIVYLVSSIPVVKSILARAEQIFQFLPWHIPWRGLICVGVLMMISSIPLWASYQHLLKVANELAFATLDIFPSRSENVLVRHIIHHFLMAIATVIVCVFILLVFTPFIANIWILLPFILICALIAKRFSSRIEDSYYHHHKQLQRAFDVNEPDADDIIDRQSVRNLLEVHTELFIVPKDALCCGKTLSEINLRHRTGATLISIYSKTFDTQIAPGGDVKLYANDCILICGNDNQIARAMNLLSKVKR